MPKLCLVCRNDCEKLVRIFQSVWPFCCSSSLFSTKMLYMHLFQCVVNNLRFDIKKKKKLQQTNFRKLKNSVEIRTNIRRHALRNDTIYCPWRLSILHNGLSRSVTAVNKHKNAVREAHASILWNKCERTETKGSMMENCCPKYSY